MRIKELLLVLVLTVVMSINVGCNKTENKSSSKNTVESITNNAQSAIEEVESYEGKTSINMDMDYETEYSVMSVKLSADFDQEAIIDSYVEHSKGKVVSSTSFTTSDIEDEETKNIETYTKENDDTYYVYDSDDGGEWVYNCLASDSNIIDGLSELFGEIEDNADDFELEESAEKLNKKKVNVISGSVSKDNLQEIINSSVADKYMDVFSEEIEDQDVEIELWFYENSDLPAKITFDMADAYEGSEINSEYSYFEDRVANSLSIEIQFTDYNCVNDLEIPDDIVENATYGIAGDYSNRIGEDDVDTSDKDKMNEENSESWDTYSIKLDNINGFTFDEEESDNYYKYYLNNENPESDLIRTTVIKNDQDAYATITSGIQDVVDYYEGTTVSDLKNITVSDCQAYYQSVYYEIEDDYIVTQIYLCIDLGDEYVYGLQRIIGGEKLNEADVEDFIINDICSEISITKTTNSYSED